MGVPKPTRDKAEGDRGTVSADVERASRVSESTEADVQDMPRNEASRQHAGGPGYDPRAGETAAQDRVPSADDITLEATLLQRSTEVAGVADWRRAERRFAPGLDADDRADADTTDRDPTRASDDPDAS